MAQGYVQSVYNGFGCVFLMRPLCRTFTLISVAIAPITVLLACSNRSGNQIKPGQAVSAVSEFVGNEACAECHAVEFRSHKASRHAQTLRFATKSGLGAQTPAPGTIPDSSYEL